MLRLTLALVLLTSYVSCDPNYKLNTPIRPISYQLYLKPYFETGDDREFTFDGQVNIMFTTTESTRQIKFHSEDLEFTAENVTLLNNGATLPLDSTNPLTWNTDYDFAYLNLQNNLTVGVEYELKIVYEGPIRDDLNGFYRNYYMEQGVKKWLGATQMEPTHARKVFPSFDEPELKAVFNIIIDRPAGYQPSLANTKIQETANLSNEYVRETFYPTPRMSTYLVAFLVSEFQAAQYYVNPSNNRELGVFTRPEAASQSNYTFDFSKRVVEALSEYFGIDYYSTNSQLKLDHIALINFRAGAMENWGLVTYREALLLYVPEESTPYYKYRVAQIIAHETTHMWFGNLVTCHWWSNTWLNEGFANYFQDYITAMIEPEVKSDDLLVTSSVYAALDADESPSSPPITNDNVYTPDEISAHFGTVTYQKAGSVIRMMHHLIGDAAFKFGLNVYLTSNAFQSGYPNLLYSALEEGVNTTNSLAAYNGATIADVMNSWVSQAGHPVLMVEVNYETNSVTLTQKRFYINGSHSSDETYMIPITYTTEVFPNFDNTKPVFVMEGKTQVVTITENISQNSWIIFNVQETGFYRVHYDSNALKIITAALKTEDHGRIHYLNRAKIVNDMFAFFFSEHVTFSVLHETLEFLTVEDNFNVWHAAIKGLTKLRNMYMGSDALADIDAYALSLMENIIASLGYEERSTDSFETLRNRMQVLEFACNLGHSGCLQSAAANFRNLVDNGVEIPPSLRPISYCAGLRLGTGSDYDFMWNRMRTTNVANEARTIGGILGCSTDPTSLNKFLVSMQEENSPILSQDLTVPLSGVLGNYSHVQLVITSLDQNLALWKSIYPSMNTVYTAIAGALRTDTELDMFESWLTSCQDCGDVQGGLNTLSSVRATTQWAQTHKAQLSSIRSSAAAIPSSVALLTICVAALMNLS